MPWLRSTSSATFVASLGFEKLGQPQPASNLSSDSKSVSPQQMHLYVPGVVTLSYSPVKGRSVAFCRATAYWVGFNCARHSASDFLTFSAIAVSHNPYPANV